MLAAQNKVILKVVFFVFTMLSCVVLNGAIGRARVARSQIEGIFPVVVSRD
jgi:hypothetical protein